MTQTVLFVDDEEELRIAGKQTLMLANLKTDVFCHADEALSQVCRTSSGILVTDIRMPKHDGLWLMRRTLEIDPDFPVILLTGYADVELAVQSMREGAFDFVEKPFATARLVSTVKHALERRRLTLENRALRQDTCASDTLESTLIGRSAPMVQLRKMIRTIGATDADVLITGQTGVGKDLVARAIHDHSKRAQHPFVHINCAALPADLFESELFGHEAGAFAGALRPRFGKFEYARRGTVFLDEIDSLAVHVQAKLLQAIQYRLITRLGSNDPVALDIRILAAAKTDLIHAIRAGTFSADLFYRLNAVTIDIPPLSARRDDIPSLFLHLTARAARQFSKKMPDVPTKVLAQMASMPWPGNVRELSNAAHRFILGLEPTTKETGEWTLSAAIADYEKIVISTALTKNHGRLKPTYETLGLSRKTLYEKMQKHSIDKAEVKR